MDKELIEFYNKMKSNITDEVGYIWLPSFEGFKVFEIPAKRLDFYLRMESLHNKAINSNEPNEFRAIGNNENTQEKCEHKWKDVPNSKCYSRECIKCGCVSIL